MVAVRKHLKNFLSAFSRFRRIEQYQPRYQNHYAGLPALFFWLREPNTNDNEPLAIS